VLLWQASVATSPHVFVIATCIWSKEIIYLLVSCNKQFSSAIPGARHLPCLYTSYIFFSFCTFVMCKDKTDVGPSEPTRKIAYYNLPRGKWSLLIKYTLRWRKRAGW
jgi:hypothetical protein